MLAPVIPTYSPPTCLRRFIAASGLALLVTAADEQFYIVPVEQLYPLFRQALPPSRATTHCCLFLTSGTATLHIGPDTYTIGPQQVLFVRAGQVYSFQLGDRNTGYFCHFHEELLIGPNGSADSLTAFAFLRFWGTPVFSLPAQTADFVGALLHRLLVEFKVNGRQSSDLLRAYLLALLHELNRALPAEAPPAPSQAAVLTNRFRQLVATALKTLPRVSDYAARLHITPNHLTKIVRAVTGKAPARWIEEAVVLEAKVLLSQSTWPVSEVAAAVGVADASYFSRLFKKHVGVSPLAYRNRLEKS